MSPTTTDWPDDMDAGARVRHVAMTRTAPRNAGWIADEADVSRDTAVKYLEQLTDRGELEAVETADGTCYKPDAVTQFLRDVRTLAEEQSPDELTDELRAIADEIDTWKATYEVESLEELRRSVGDDELSADERRERREIVAEWEYNTQIREELQLAIDLQESLTRIDRNPHTRNDSSDTLPQKS